MASITVPSEADGPAEASSEPRPSGVSLRAVLIGLAFLAGLAFLLPYLADVKAGSWRALPRMGPIPPVAILILLLVLYPINGLLAWRWPTRALSRKEILTIYALVAASVAMTDSEYASPLVSMMTSGTYLANPGNRWDTLVTPHIPLWLQVSDPQAVLWAWEGIPDGTPIPWAAWRSPLFWWGAIAFCLWAGSFSLMSLLRRDWIEAQRLVFPLAQIPLAVVGDEGRPGMALLRRPVFWAGFGIAFLHGVTKLLNQYYPAFPYYSMQWSLGSSFPPNVLPWGPLHDLQFNLDWSALGIMCLLPGEVSLSFWVFNLWYYAQLVLLAALGFAPGGSTEEGFNPRLFYGYANAGALVGFGVLVLHQSRRVIVRAIRSWWAPECRERDPLDLLKPRYAVLVLLLSIAGMCWFGMAARVDMHRLLLLLVAFYVVSIAFSRVVSAAGANYVEIAMWPTRYFVDNALGSNAVRPASFGMLCPMDAIFMTEYNESFMTYAANDMKVFHSSRLRGTTVVLALGAAVVLMLALAPIGKIWAGHQRGFTGIAEGGYVYGQVPNWEFGYMAERLQNPRGPAIAGTISMVVGAATAVALSLIQMKVHWWRMSPVGYLISGPGYGLNHLVWANAFVGWTVVGLIFRFGGLRLYSTLRPAFIGLFLGGTSVTLVSSAVLLIDRMA